MESPPSVSGSFFLCCDETAPFNLGCLGLSTTDRVAGSKAEPRCLVRGCPPVGAAESSTTSSIAQPHSMNAAGPRFACEVSLLPIIR